jgi:3-oxoacyl-[acyl-carrier protein] reductase
LVFLNKKHMTNKVALVTGGSRGIGLGIATELAALGYNLAINGQRPEHEVASTLAQLTSYGIKVIYCPGNIANKTDRQQILDSIKAQYGSLNLHVNNAGVAAKVRMDMLQTTEESYNHVVDTNLKGSFFLTQAIANWFIDLKAQNPEHEAAIVNITSISATVASNNRAEYCMAKAGLAMMNQLYAIRLAEYHIPVYEVRPGLIQTDMTAVVHDKYSKLIADGLVPEGRWGLPADVGKVVAAVAQGQFKFSTGQVFIVDGGLTLARF